MIRFTAFLIALAGAAPAVAGDIVVDLKTPAGKPVADAVVTFHPAQGSPTPAAAGKTYNLVQEHIQFTPHVLVVPVGASVVFPNHDKVRHHVYSFSAAKRFELKLYGKEEARSVVFDKAGVAAVGCNIHDAMSAFIYVADTPWAAKSDPAGHVQLSGVPAGAGTLTVWHPQLRQPRNELRRTLASPRQGDLRQSLTVDIRDAAAMPPMS